MLILLFSKKAYSSRTYRKLLLIRFCRLSPDKISDTKNNTKYLNIYTVLIMWFIMFTKLVFFYLNINHKTTKQSDIVIIKWVLIDT